MEQAAFSHVRTWVFDLDNTLYPPSMRLFDQIEVKMTAWVMANLGLAQPEANRLRADYWAQYGTTLAGLMAEHGVDPVAYLADVHDINFSVLSPDPALAARISALPGRRIVFTNGDAPYARKVITARGLDDIFDEVYGVEHANFHPKPEAVAFETVFSLDGFDRHRAAMFEDDPRNLAVPHAMGLRTIHIAPEAAAATHIHHHAADLSAFLAKLTTI